VKPRIWKTRPARAGASVLAAALAVEFIDELVDGTKDAALPLIRHDLGLTYGQIGLLASAPLLLGSLLELPVGVLAGHGRARRLTVLAGGVVFILSLAAVATARSFAGLLIAFVLFFPASGAFVSLTQSGLMDADPGRHEQHMARWNLAGSAGAVAGPVLLAGVLAAGGGWRAAYLVLASCAAVAWLGVARRGPRPGPAPPLLPRAESVQPGAGEPGVAEHARAPALRRVGRALRQPGVARWLVLLQVSDLLLDILTGFLALYLVDVVRTTPEQAALAVAVRLGAGLAGDVVLIRALERVSGLRLLGASAAAAALLYPGFLLLPGFGPKLAVLALLTVVTAPWYPVLQAQLYRSLPGESGVVVSLSSASTLLAGAVPLAVGFLAQQFGLAWAITGLAVAPLGILGGVWRARQAGGRTK
jgi:MFS transporter, FSR family, fosmidomycin resistance protein